MYLSLQGAGIGLLFSLAVCFWIGVGSILNPVTRVTLTNTITACASSINLFNNNSLDSITNLSVSLVTLQGDSNVTLFEKSDVYTPMNSTLVPADSSEDLQRYVSDVGLDARKPVFGVCE